MPNVKERLRSLACRLVVSTGLTRLGRRVRDQDGSIILCGHRVSDDDEAFFQGLAPNWFREQLQYLTRHYEIIPLQTVVRCIEERRPIPPRSVVLTFDDGFLDFFEQALPILGEFGAPATVFVVTESLTDGRLPWSQRLGYMFRTTVAAELEHVLLGGRPVSLSSEAERRKAYAVVKSALAPAPRESRDATIDEIGRCLGVEPPRDRMMRWEHAREVVATGHEVGAHTFSHALLARVPPAEAEIEMERSRFDLEERLGLRSPAFCFPGGSTTAALRRVARDIGFRSCFAPDGRKRLNRLGEVDAYSMVRLGLPNAPAIDLEAEIDGPFHTVRRLTGRYARTDEH